MKNSYFIEIFLDEENEISEEYDNLYSEDQISQIPSFYYWFYRKISKPKKGKILDVACGKGEFLKICDENGLETFGIDISTFALKNPHQKGAKSDFCVSDAEKLPYKSDSFDYVSNIGSLEHFISPVIGLSEISRVLKQNGQAYILVPNTFSILSNIWNVLRTGKISIDNQPIQRYGTRSDWENLISSNDLLIEKVIKYERPVPINIKDTIYYIKRPKEVVRLILSLIIPTNLSWCFLFICKKV